MSDQTRSRDARLDELALLSRFDAIGGFTKVGPYPTSAPGSAEKQLVVHLLDEEFVNGIDSLPWTFNGEMQNAINWHLPHGNAPMQRSQIQRKWTEIDRALGGQEVNVAISHRGRVRLAELRQQLKSNREREPSGIFWDRYRHLETDVAIALLDATPAEPVSVAFVDMNGLKKINDTAGGHETGDRAIQIYLQTLASTIGNRGEGFRANGGDEVIVVFMATKPADAEEIMRKALGQLGREAVPGNALPYFTASCGIASATSPKDVDVVNRADKEMYRAKPVGKKTEPWKSAIAVVGGEVVTVTV